MTSQQTHFEVEVIHLPAINFAFQQNHIPVIRKLSIRNISDSDLQNIDVELISEPDFASHWHKKIELINKNETLDIGTVNLKISTKYLSELTEKVAGIFTLNIRGNNNVLYSSTYNIDVLAYDQWSGITVMPELLAAFVTPNHPEIPKIIKRASAILAQWTGSPSFDEYQTRNPDRVKKQMAAIYEAVAERQIIYCTVPASFEERGQRIRTADTIQSQQMGNCLDLTLLYASCLEAVGIHSLIIAIKGHAFAGGWLINDSFADSVSDDPSVITKRMADGINEITVVEATSMNAGQNMSFDNAIRHAESHLNKTEDFTLFIDVQRARFSGIRPLPLRIKTENGWNITEEISIERKVDAPETIAERIWLTNNNKVVSKQTLWERKLLDLSLRNNLLNLRISKGTVQFISVALGKLEDDLASGNEFQILPKPQDWDNSLRHAGVYQAVNQSDPVTDLVKHELTQKRLRCYLTDHELSNSLVSLYRSSKLSLEENGANTLYVALGLLKWYETKTSEKPRYAPILLLPVEIIRKSAQKGYVIRSREEETMMNITLLEMLRQDFGINIPAVETLPKDESGVDVKLIFNTVRQAIMPQSRWDVEEQSFLSNFSFNKFIMWNDIHSNADKLSQNKIVASLISGKIEWEIKDTSNIEVNDLDKTYHPADVALPISADSSQLEAICAAAEGKSFILHGPPGTGKSQTITNIIANALYKGKKVLFVAEKMAALSVVQNRLEAIGLNPFCLELHSNKSKKSAVLEQLKKTTEVIKKAPPQDFSSEAERLHKIRIDLNDYVETLHKLHPSGMSIYDAFNEYALYATAADKISFDETSIDTLRKEQITTWNDLVEELQGAGTICGHPYNHPLGHLHIEQYNQSLKNEGRSLIGNYIHALDKLQSKLAFAIKCAAINIDIEQKQQFQSLKQLCETIITLPNIPANLFTVESIEQTSNQIQAIVVHGKTRDELRNSLLKDYNNNILSFDADIILTEWNIADKKWFLPKLLKQNKIAKSLRSLSRNGEINKNDIVLHLQKVIDYKKEQAFIDSNSPSLSPLLGLLWQNGNCDWDNMVNICNGLVNINKEFSELIKVPAKIKEWRYEFAKGLTEGLEIYLMTSKQHLHDYISAYNSLEKSENELERTLGVNFRAIDGLQGNRIENCKVYALQWHDNIEQLREWIIWLQIRQKALANGLNAVVSAYENGSLNNNEVIACYKKGLYRSIAEYIFKREPVLASFNGQLFEDKIKRFRQITKQFEQLTKDELYARLASKIPSVTQGAVQSSEIGILQRAIRNGGRGISIRKLFDSIPNLLPRICPCMLMSPISVAQYFDAGTTKFDLVVFDEASQMPTCEAVGAIARGTNVIVVGDPKQMPPTSFFSSYNIDEENIDKEDLESILDDCLALSMPSNYLLWHYRSKHESLIAFSNSKYYDNKLLTFPSTDDITTKVTHVAVEGFYDKAKSRQNAAEGRAIVSEIIRRLSDTELSKLSIGVVTFSSAQQILIDDLLEEALKARPDLEARILTSAEPLFIKNLENVQGDERDVILFSIGYGPDKEGKISLNFGPLNRGGGWRRLNVAVSRARYEMKVFSTLKADQIDLNRTNSEGVAGLKAFLEYAEKGRAALEYRNRSKSLTTVAFTELVAGEIKKLGYSVHTNVGCSGYKIDIGIVNPANPSEYILGILCDGYNYKEAKTAKDREIVQVEVLKMLGWNIFKVWSAEWWENSSSILKNIIDRLKDVETSPTPEKLLPVTLAEPVMDAALNTATNTVTDTLIEKQPVYDSNMVEYANCTLDFTHAGSSDDFLQPHNNQKICNQILQVIEVEAPISKNLLCKRILAAWGISRAGTRISAQFEILFKRLNLEQTGDGANKIFWKAGQTADNYAVYRVHKNELYKRDADDLPPEEVANAIRELLINQVSLPKNELVRESAKIFGFSRIGNNVELSMHKGITAAITKGYAREEDNRIIFNETLN